ncbi:MAG TPA: CPBP family intramembrane glutamic endopeptidase [Flavobacteriales bacterium]
MRRIGGYLLWAFGISWAIVGAGFLLGVRSAAHPFYILVAALCMLGPALAAIIQQRLIDRAPWAGLGLPLRPTDRPVFLGTVLIGLSLIPVLFGVLAVFEALGAERFGQVSITTERLMEALAEMLNASGSPSQGTSKILTWASGVPGGVALAFFLIAALFAALTVNLPFMLGEELGWRGYLWSVTAHWSGLRRVGFTGVVWGLWHAPLILMGHNYPEHPFLGIGLMVVFCTLLAFLFDWTRTRSRSIWSSCVLHGLINGTAGASVIFAWGGRPLVAGITGVAGFITIALLVVVVCCFDRRYRKVLFGPAPV